MTIDRREFAKLGDWPDIIKDDFIRLFMGQRLGGGVSREVFAHALDDTKVFKIESESRSFSNIIEWEVWNHVKHDKKWKRWFAPCHFISPCGMILVQERTRPLHDNDQLPGKIPNFLSDVHYGNFGMVGDQLVAHDYGFLSAVLNVGFRSTSPRLVNCKRKKEAELENAKKIAARTDVFATKNIRE